MVYLIGIVGFICGFALGVQVISWLLRDRKTEDLVQDKSLRWSYGLMVWLMAAGVSAISVLMYRAYLDGWHLIF